MESSQPDPVTQAAPRRRRLLRAVFASDMCNFSGLVSVDETRTLDDLMIVRRLAHQEIEGQDGQVFGLPGDGIFAVFESAIGAVRASLAIQSRLAAMPKLGALRFRIGLHVGEVLFEGTMPFGEAIVIAARLESLADPGGILVSGSVMEATASRISATFAENGVQRLKHSPRRIQTYKVLPAPLGLPGGGDDDTLDATVFTRKFDRRAAAAAWQDDAEAEGGAGKADLRLPRATPLVLPAIKAPEPELAPIVPVAIPALPTGAEPALPVPVLSVPILPASILPAAVLPAPLLAAPALLVPESPAPVLPAPILAASILPEPILAAPILPLPIVSEPTLLAPGLPVAILPPATLPPATVPPATMPDSIWASPPDLPEVVAAPLLTPPPTPKLDAAGLAELAKLLVGHLGPVASILVRRHAAQADDPHHLVESLAVIIPSDAERTEFRHHAEILIRRAQ